MNTTSLTYVINQTAFHCAPTEDGRYVWSTLDETCRAGAIPGTRKYWASCQGLVLGRDYSTLARAMRASVNFKSLMGVRRGSPRETLLRPSANEAGLSFEMQEAA